MILYYKCANKSLLRLARNYANLARIELYILSAVAMEVEEDETEDGYRGGKEGRGGGGGFELKQKGVIGQH